MPAIVPVLGSIARKLLAIAIILPIAGAAGLAVIHAQGHQLLSVQTASMVPTFRPGDALIVAPVSVRYLRPGDVISYHSPRDPAVIVSHRLVSIDRQAGLLTTSGDALQTQDPAFPPDQVAGRVMAVAPRLGLVLDTLRRPLALVLAVYLPAGLVVAAEVHRLARVYADPLYSAKLETCDLKPSSPTPMPSSTART